IALAAHLDFVTGHCSLLPRQSASASLNEADSGSEMMVPSASTILPPGAKSPGDEPVRRRPPPLAPPPRTPGPAALNGHWFEVGSVGGGKDCWKSRAAASGSKTAGCPATMPGWLLLTAVGVLGGGLDNPASSASAFAIIVAPLGRPVAGGATPA